MFEQLLHALRGYPLRIKDEEHRAELLRDCRYFHLRGLEQRLVRCEIGFDAKRDVEEITIGLEDVKTTGLSIVERNNLPVQEPDVPAIVSRRGWVHYKRPFVDEQARELIIEIGGEKDPTMLDLDEGKAAFRGRSQAKVDALLKAVAKKVDPDVTLTLPGDGSLTFSINETTDLNLDGKSASLEAWDNMADETAARRGKKRKLDDTVEREPVQWEVRTGQWKLLLHRPLDSCNMAIVLVAMKIDAFSCEKARNARRRFLS